MAALAAIMVLGAATAATAQDPGPRMVGSGEDARVVYAQPSRNIVGGRTAIITGSGDDLRITYAPGGASQAPDGSVAELQGSGQDAQLIYRALETPWSMLGQRGTRPPAWQGANRPGHPGSDAGPT